MLKDTLQADIKEAMLARDTARLDVLKGLKTAILYAEVEAKKREEGLNDSEIIAVFRKEAKKRQDAIELYEKAGNTAMAEKEKAEKVIIETYLPEQLDETKVTAIVNEVLESEGMTALSRQDMGKIIKLVKEKTGDSADGSLIAKVVNSKVQ